MENKILKSPIPAYFLIVCLKSRTKNKPFKPIQFTQHLQTIVSKQRWVKNTILSNTAKHLEPILNIFITKPELLFRGKGNVCVCLSDQYECAPNSGGLPPGQPDISQGHAHSSIYKHWLLHCLQHYIFSMDVMCFIDLK